MKRINLTPEDKAAIAREQIAVLKSEHRRWWELRNQDAHKVDAPRQMEKIDAEIRRFKAWGGLK